MFTPSGGGVDPPHTPLVGGSGPPRRGGTPWRAGGGPIVGSILKNFFKPYCWANFKKFFCPARGIIFRAASRGSRGRVPQDWTRPALAVGPGRLVRCGGPQRRASLCHCPSNLGREDAQPSPSRRSFSTDNRSSWLSSLDCTVGTE